MGCVINCIHSHVCTYVNSVADMTPQTLMKDHVVLTPF